MPTLALQLLDPAYRAHFAFALVGEDMVRDTSTIKVTFDEPSRPTLIALNGNDLPASGAIWIRPADGAIVQTLLQVQAPNLPGCCRHDDVWLEARANRRAPYEDNS